MIPSAKLHGTSAAGEERLGQQDGKRGDGRFRLLDERGC